MFKGAQLVQLWLKLNKVCIIAGGLSDKGWMKKRELWKLLPSEKKLGSSWAEKGASANEVVGTMITRGQFSLEMALNWEITLFPSKVIS